MAEWLLVLACGAATYLWRGLGVLLSARVRTTSAAFVWVGCVAYAMIAGLTARILLMPSGTLGQTELSHRLLAAAIALAVFFVVTRRNLFLGVCAGFLAMVALASL